MPFPIISVLVMIVHHLFRLNNISWGKKKKNIKVEEKAQDNAKDSLGVVETITKWSRFAPHQNK